MRLALLQLNTTVGDLAGNSAKIREWAIRAGEAGADLAITPEMALMGYPPRDLVLQPDFVAAGWEAAERLAASLEAGPPVLAGLARKNDSGRGRPVFNTAVLLRHGRIEGAFHKTLLPTYDVFDEDRYFEPAHGPQVLDLDGFQLGISICEDIWTDADFQGRRLYHVDPLEGLRAEAAGLINLSASPFTVGKLEHRTKIMSDLARKYGRPLIYVNQVGGNDEIIFDGRSTVMDGQGRLVGRAKGFEEDLLLVELDRAAGVSGSGIAPDDLEPESEIWRALVLGTRDYTHKCGFKKALLGLSGGIDSSLTAAVAAEALGPENVLGVMMPSPYSSRSSLDDSVELAEKLGIETIELPIEPIMKAFEATLAEPFAGMAEDVTEENIQARIRGNLLMSVSNKFGSLLLTTGNKSELAVGYCTLYGDMSGGLAVISDVPKTMVYRVCRWLNQERRQSVIPDSVLTKPPSAELRPDQTDQDSLPPYEVIDEIVRLHVEEFRTGREIIEAGFDSRTVNHVCRLIKIAEFKRSQAAPGLKVTDRAFGAGWQMPIAARFEI